MVCNINKGPHSTNSNIYMSNGSTPHELKYDNIIHQIRKDMELEHVTFRSPNLIHEKGH